MLGRSPVRVGVCGTARRSTGPRHVRGTELALAGGTAELVFPPQAGRDHGAQRSGPRPGNEVFALLGRTGTGQTVRSLSPTPRSPQTVSLASPGPPAAPPPTWPVPGLGLAVLVVTATAVFPASAAVEGAPPDRPCLLASGEASFSGSERLRLPPRI